MSCSSSPHVLMLQGGPVRDLRNSEYGAIEEMRRKNGLSPGELCQRRSIRWGIVPPCGSEAECIISPFFAPALMLTIES
jgi:hypothetical protein